MDHTTVKKIREDLQITQAELARRMGVKVHTVKRWERGTRSIRGSSLVLLQFLAKEK